MNFPFLETSVSQDDVQRIYSYTDGELREAYKNALEYAGGMSELEDEERALFIRLFGEDALENKWLVYAAGLSEWQAGQECWDRLKRRYGHLFREPPDIPPAWYRYLEGICEVVQRELDRIEPQQRRLFEFGQVNCKHQNLRCDVIGQPVDLNMGPIDEAIESAQDEVAGR